MHVSTSIRLSDETKSMLEVIKRDEESWDEFLVRLARRERDVEALSGFAGDAGIVEHVDERNEALGESLDANRERDDLSG